MAQFALVFRSQNGKSKTEEISTWQLFHDFISHYVSLLIERGFIEIAENYMSRITPRYDDKSQYGREIVYMETSERIWLEEDSRSGWNSEAQRNGAPLRYFTLTLCTSPRRFVYRKDFPLSALDQTVMKRLQELQRTFDPLQQTSQAWKWDIIAKEEATDTPLERSHIDQTISVMFLLPSLSTHAGNNEVEDDLSISLEEIKDIDEYDAIQEPLEISIEKVEIVLPIMPPIPGPRQIEGVRVANESEILISRPTLEGIMKESNIHLEGKMTGGLLIGQAYKEAIGETLVTYITSYISANKDVENKSGIYLLGAETWEAMLRIKKQKYPLDLVVGWYREHLIGTWLSPDDELLHMNFFREPWHVALLLDRMHGARQFYRKEGGGFIVPKSAFQIIG